MAPSPGSKHLEVSGTFNQMSDRSQSIRAAFFSPWRKKGDVFDSLYQMHLFFSVEEAGWV